MSTVDEKAQKKAERAANRAARQERARERQQAASAKLAALRMNARFEGWTLANGTLSKGLTKMHDVAGAVAEFQHGANIGGRITLTRVALTGIFALGLKKDRNKVYVLIELADGQQEMIEAKAKHEKDARRFTAAINAASRYYSDQA